MNYDFMKSFDIKNKTVLYNHTNGTSVEINKKVFEMIKDCDTKESILELAKMKSDSDRKFLESLAETIDEKQLFADCSSDKINEITYIITDNCNLCCKHCCMSAKPYKRERDGEVTVRRDILEKILTYDPIMIVLTGGEPLIASNILESLVWLRQNFNNTIVLSTNSLLINESNVKIIAETTDIIDISLDGVTEEKSDFIRGKGTFDKVMNVIQMLNSAGAKRIRLSNALSPEELDDVENYSKLCNELGVEALVRDLCPTGRALENHLSCRDPLSHFLNSVNFNPNLCGAGVSMISVDKNGDVFPCNNFSDDEFKMGNILNENFNEDVKDYWKKVWFSNFSRYLSRYREECRDCEVSQYCWTCPFDVKLIEDYKGIKNLTDICTAKKKRIMKAFENE